ncbi:peptidoglycan DD-metalloendopeptidase family protein [Arsenicicoccus piscis]|nr:M23 family metallopeptidase [Arsenicicoccus piscis]MCH8628323.1 peptidoglycan DD-metalloendopeptidase family protein [Arsenicicoccus piscis]
MSARPGPAGRRRLGLPALLLAAGLGLGVAPTATATTDPGGDDLEAQKAAVDAAVAQLRGQLDETDADLATAYLELYRAQRQIPIAQRALTLAQQREATAVAKDKQLAAQLVAARAAEAASTKRLGAINAQITRTSTVIGQLASEMYQRSDLSDMSLLLQAQSPEELADRSSMIDAVSGIQSQAMRDLASVRAAAIAEEAHLEAIRTEVARLKDESAAAVVEAAAARKDAAAAKAAVDRLAAQKQTAASQVEARKQAEIDRLAQMDRESRQLSAQLAERARLAREAAARSKAAAPPTQGSGFLTRPANGQTTSGFGMRVHPVLHTQRMHTGLDWAVPCGTPVYAAADGTIISRQLKAAWGNQIIIDHGLVNGVNLTTTYNHLSSFAASGAVKRGQLIGYSGTTGWSTGCHLHFETWNDGTPVDPNTWL